MFQLIVSGTFFNVNDQNIGPLSLSPSSPYLLTPSLLLSLSLSLSPSIPLSLSHSLPFSFSHSPYVPDLFLYPSLFISLYFSTSLPLYFSTYLPSPFLELEQATPVASRHRACYTTTLVVIISYQGNQGYPGNQLLEFL